MDLLCTRCGEPWDAWLNSGDMTPEEVKRFKAGEGCPCCYGKPDSEVHNRAPESSYIQSELAAVLGDDTDGLAAMMEDFNLI